MKDQKFNKAIHDIKKIVMTSTEKRLVFDKVMEKISSQSADEIGNSVPKIGSIRSPFSVFHFGISIRKYLWVSVIIITITTAFVGNSVVLASYGALPGDTLYPIKVGIVEPIRVAIASTPVVKAEIQAELVQERLREVETLTARGTLTETEEREINQRLEKQASDLAANLSLIKEISLEKTEDISTTIEARVETHRHVLDALVSDKTNDPEKKSTEKSYDNQVTKKFIASKNKDEKIVLNVSSRDTLIDQNNKETDKKEKSEYETKKLKLQSLIRDTSTKIVLATSTATSSAQSMIINEVQTTLEKAQKQLDEADYHEKKGEKDESNSALVDTERFTKEARFLLEAKVRLDDEVKKRKTDYGSKEDKDKVLEKSKTKDGENKDGGEKKKDKTEKEGD